MTIVLVGASSAYPQWETNAKGVFSVCQISISYCFWTKMVFFFYHFLIFTMFSPPFCLFTQQHYFIPTLTI